MVLITFFLRTIKTSRNCTKQTSYDTKQTNNLTNILNEGMKFFHNAVLILRFVSPLNSPKNKFRLTHYDLIYSLKLNGFMNILNQYEYNIMNYESK